MVGLSGERGADRHHVAPAKQGLELVHRFNDRDDRRPGHVQRIHCAYAHPETGGALGDLPAGTAEAHYPHGEPPELECGPAHRHSGLPGPALQLHGRLERPCQRQQQRECVIGQVGADQPLFAGQRNRTLPEIIKQITVYPGSRGVDPPEPTGGREQFRVQMTQQRVGVGNFGQRLLGVCGHHDLRPGPGCLPNAAALRSRNPGQGGGVGYYEYFHGG